MVKFEIICENCDTHYIVALEESNPTPEADFCPFCGAALVNSDSTEEGE